MVDTHPKFIHEILDLIGKAKDKQERIELLKKHDSNVLKNILIGSFDDAIEWNLPDTPPPYNPADEHLPPSTINKQLNQLPYFIKGNKGDGLSKVKREAMFIRMIETIHPKDAEVVLAMVAKKLGVKGLTKALVKEVFPNLIRK
jgi:hypothetical protein